MTDVRPAVLFDIDGTLVDTNYFHSISWWRALRDAGEEIPVSAIHPLIGMGSDKLLEASRLQDWVAPRTGGGWGL